MCGNIRTRASENDRVACANVRTSETAVHVLMCSGKPVTISANKGILRPLKVQKGRFLVHFAHIIVRLEAQKNGKSVITAGTDISACGCAAFFNDCKSLFSSALRARNITSRCFSSEFGSEPVQSWQRSRFHSLLFQRQGINIGASGVAQ